MRHLVIRPAVLASAALVITVASAASAQAAADCERKCYTAETCPIAGLKCLSFEVCRDVCPADDAGSGTDRGRDSIPKLPGPGDGKGTDEDKPKLDI